MRVGRVSGSLLLASIAVGWIGCAPARTLTFRGAENQILDPRGTIAVVQGTKDGPTEHLTVFVETHLEKHTTLRVLDQFEILARWSAYPSEVPLKADGPSIFDERRPEVSQAEVVLSIARGLKVDHVLVLWTGGATILREGPSIESMIGLRNRSREVNVEVYAQLYRREGESMRLIGWVHAHESDRMTFGGKMKKSETERLSDILGRAAFLLVENLMNTYRLPGLR